MDHHGSPKFVCFHASHPGWGGTTCAPQYILGEPCHLWEKGPLTQTTSPLLQWGWVEGLWRPVVRWLDAQRHWQWQIPLRSLPAQPKAKGIGLDDILSSFMLKKQDLLTPLLTGKKSGISALLDLEMRRHTAPGIKQWADGFSSSPWVA